MAEEPIKEPAEPYIDYAKATTPMSELLVMAQEGDIVGLAQAAREQTTFDRGDPVVLILAIAMLIMALSRLIDRTGVAVKPITEAAADNMRKGPPRA
jgi:hypothetical protein